MAPDNGKETKIGIIIITYNRPDEMYELVQNISRLDEVETLVQEIVVVNNRSSLSYENTEAFINSHPELPFRYISSGENLGVSAGRNFAIRQSTAPVLVFLDDDALFENRDALIQIRNIFSEISPEEARTTGIVAFKVFYHSLHTMQQNAFPHKQFRQRKDWHNFQTSYFSGCGHAIHRPVFDKAGFYPENFFYGMEEYDLSYRALDAGFQIVYDDRIIIQHKESPAGRLPPAGKLRGMWVNKSKVAWKYLPVRYYLSTAFLWSFEYLRKTGFHLPGWWKGWNEIAAICFREKRTPLKSETLLYLKKVKARLWY